MQTNTITLTDEATRVINALQHSCGTYDYYRSTLNRLFNYILHCSDEIGMSDTEAVSTLRTLDAIRSDLATISGTHNIDGERDTTDVENCDPADTEAPHELLSRHEMMRGVHLALEDLNHASRMLSYAIDEATLAGLNEGFNSIAGKLFDLKADLVENTIAKLDEIKAIDVDSYEYREPTEQEKTAYFLDEARKSAINARELMADALDHAHRIEGISEAGLTEIKATYDATRPAMEALDTMARKFFEYNDDARTTRANC